MSGARGAASRTATSRLGPAAGRGGTAQESTRRGKAEQAHLNFDQKREDAQMQQEVHGTEAKGRRTYLGKDSRTPKCKRDSSGGPDQRRRLLQTPGPPRGGSEAAGSGRAWEVGGAVPPSLVKLWAPRAT